MGEPFTLAFYSSTASIATYRQIDTQYYGYFFVLVYEDTSNELAFNDSYINESHNYYFAAPKEDVTFMTRHFGNQYRKSDKVVTVWTYAISSMLQKVPCVSFQPFTSGTLSHGSDKLSEKIACQREILTKIQRCALTSLLGCTEFHADSLAPTL